MKAFIRAHLNDILLAFFVMASAARGIGQIYPLAGPTAVPTARVEQINALRPEPLGEPFPR